MFTKGKFFILFFHNYNNYNNHNAFMILGYCYVSVLLNSVCILVFAKFIAHTYLWQRLKKFHLISFKKSVFLLQQVVPSEQQCIALLLSLYVEAAAYFCNVLICALIKNS